MSEAVLVTIASDPDEAESRPTPPAPGGASDDELKLWQQIFLARYVAIGALTLVAIAFPAIGPNRLWMAAGLILVAAPMTAAFERDMRRHGRLSPALAFVDQALAAIVIALEPSYLVAGLLVMLTMTATSAVAYGRRVAAQAAAVGWMGVAITLAFSDTEDPLRNLLTFTIMDICTVVAVGGMAFLERSQRERQSELLEGLGAVVWEQPLPGTHRVFMNPEVERLLGHPLEHWAEAGSWERAIHPDDRARVTRALREIVREGDDVSLLYRLHAADDRVVHVEERMRVERHSNGRPVALRGVLVDITEKVAAAAQMDQYLKLVSAIQMALVVLELHDLSDDGSLVVAAANPEAVQLLTATTSTAELIGLTAAEALAGAGGQSEAMASSLADVVRSGEGFVAEEFRIETHATARVHLVHAFPLPGRAVGLSLQDVTERAMAAEVLRRQALHDGLTGLPNRTLLTDRLRAALSHAEASGDEVALLVMDLDQFKEVNDTLGHDHGDRLLVEVGRRLQRVLREADTVARLGGDEFAVLLAHDGGPEAAFAAARHIRQTLEQPFQISGVTLQTNGSIGVAVFPTHATDAETLAQRADVAMYTAKRTGGGVALYAPEHDQSSLRRLAILGELRTAIEANQLVLHYQPTLDLRTRTIAGCEALVRWQHPDHGLIPPNEFIELAEVSGTIGALTRWVLAEALRQAVGWREQGLPLHVAVNLSVRNLYDPDLVGWTNHLLLDLGITAPMLTLEITESELMHDPVQAMDVLGKLKALGVSISIDDFGTGYSSLAYLKHLPIDELKIDRSFVGSMTTEDSDLTIVRSTIDLAHNLGLGVVAEGVEDALTMRGLDELGCDRIQGYFLARPMPGPDLWAWSCDERWSDATREL